MTGFDGELYLRLCGERSVLDHAEGRPWDDPVAGRARALIAVGALSAASAQQVVDDYVRARALRGSGRPWPSGRARRGNRPDPPTQRRLWLCDHTVLQPWGELLVRYISLTDRGTSVAVTARAAVPGAARSSASSSLSSHGPGGLTVTDDRGTSAVMGFSGGGSDSEWKGSYRGDQPLALDTAWLEVAGERIALTSGTSLLTVTLDRLTDDPASRYLERCLEGLGGRGPGTGSVGEGVEALLACGALTTDSALVAETLAVAGALQPAYGTASGPAALPERWRTLLAGRGRSGGPTGAVAIGVTVPDLDGVSLGLVVLESTDESFDVSIETAGAEAPRAFTADLEATVLTYTAIDDRGGHYLGQLGNWSGNGTEITGELTFWPALDPRARALDVVVTGPTTRAVVRVPLTWVRKP